MRDSEVYNKRQQHSGRTVYLLCHVGLAEFIYVDKFTSLVLLTCSAFLPNGADRVSGCSTEQQQQQFSLYEQRATGDRATHTHTQPKYILHMNIAMQI